MWVSKIPFVAGQKFGRWTVIAETPYVPGKPVLWTAQCDCGVIRNVDRFALRSGKSKSCGGRSAGKKIHGGSKSRTYRTWRAMKLRCHCKTSENYHHYGGRGISICERWLKFENFLEDMGEAPTGLTLERKDPNGNYEPSNCVWANCEAQSNNRRGIKMFFIDGEWRSRAQAGRHWKVSFTKASRLVLAYEMKIIGE